MILLAFMAGCIGAIVGGTQVFIAYGIAGIFVTLLETAGLKMTFYNEAVMSVFLLPAVIFNGNVLATAYAGKKYDIKGWDINKSLAFTRDPIVIVLGGIGAVIGYLVFRFFVNSGLPADQGACTVFLVEVLFRIIFQRGSHINKENFEVLKHQPLKIKIYDILLGVIFAYAAGYFVLKTNLMMVPFYLSATSLILCFIDPPFPATHHITIVASYAAFYSHHLALAILFGVIAHIIFVIFAAVFNSNFETHIDPPAVAIVICSFIIFMLFK